jgi:hypothetical protein
MFMSAEMLTAIGSVIGIFLTAGIAWLKLKIERAGRTQAENEVTFQRAALRFTELVGEWAEISEMVTDAIDKTRLDRFMVLRAWNGELSPQWTTAVHQIREVGQTPMLYIHVELDTDYIDKLRSVVSSGYKRFEVNKLSDDSLAASIYKREGVTDSLWAHLASYHVPGTESRAIEYVSFATHHPDGFDEETLTACRLMVGRLKGLSMSFTE